MRTLIIRVTDGEGKQPVTDGRRQSDTWFGTHDLALAGNLNSMVRILFQTKDFLLRLLSFILTDLHCKTYLI